MVQNILEGTIRVTDWFTPPSEHITALGARAFVIVTSPPAVVIIVAHVSARERGSSPRETVLSWRQPLRAGALNDSGEYEVLQTPRFIVDR